MAGEQDGGSGGARNFSITEVLAYIGYRFGLIFLSLGLIVGISIDPRVNLHGRLGAYAFGAGGLTLALICKFMEQKSFFWKMLYLLATIIAFGLTCYQVIRLS